MAFRSTLACCSVVLGLLGALAEGPPGADEWKYDVIHRKGQPTLRGLIVEQKGDNITIKTITRKPGAPTLVRTDYVSRREILRLEPLSAEDREVLQGRLDGLKRQRDM